jgi:hypothetical protein
MAESIRVPRAAAWGEGQAAWSNFGAFGSRRDAASAQLEREEGRGNGKHRSVVSRESLHKRHDGCRDGTWSG